MKKMFFSALILLGTNLAANAQWSSITIVNHSTTCDYSVRLGANFKDNSPGGSTYTSCDYETQDFVVALGGGTVSAGTYFDFAAVIPFAVAPSLPSAPTSYTPAGTSATWGSAGCFSWETAQIWPATAIYSPPGTNSPHPCGPTNVVGTGYCGPDNPSPAIHVWTKNPTTGDVTLDLY